MTVIQKRVDDRGVFQDISGFMGMRRQLVFSFGISAMFLVCSIHPSQILGSFVVAPNTSVSVEGSGSNNFPFNLSGFPASIRYQQVYSASEFSSFSPLGGLITQISFRPDASTGAAFSSTIANIQLDLSTTAAAPATLSTTFANNVGADNITVFGPGSLTLSSAFAGPAAGPKTFDITITLATPFFYNPTLGNLLLDVRNFSGGATTPFDLETSPSLGRVSTFFNGVNSPTAESVSNNNGLVTQFTYSVVPEPSSSTLAVLAGASMAFATLLTRARRRAS